MKKTQTVSYTGTGYFVVDLDKLTKASIIEDKDKKTVTIKIGHPQLRTSLTPPNEKLYISYTPIMQQTGVPYKGHPFRFF